MGTYGDACHQGGAVTTHHFQRRRTAVWTQRLIKHRVAVDGEPVGAEVLFTSLTPDHTGTEFDRLLGAIAKWNIQVAVADYPTHLDVD